MAVAVVVHNLVHPLLVFLVRILHRLVVLLRGYSFKVKDHIFVRPTEREFVDLNLIGFLEIMEDSFRVTNASMPNNRKDMRQQRYWSPNNTYREPHSFRIDFEPFVIHIDGLLHPFLLRHIGH